MSVKVWSGGILVVLLLLVVWSASLQYITMADSDNETALENSARNAMTQAVNLGNARVNEIVTINEEVAIEALVRQYSDTSDFFDGDRYLSVHKVSENPAMIAVDSYMTLETSFPRIANKSNKEDIPLDSTTRSREIIIFEATKLEK